jgi:formiminotetrahydrofolate cyclodeaminase
VASADETIGGFVGALGSSASTPGGGAAAAVALAVGAACAQMVASLTVGRRKYADVEEQFRQLERSAAAAAERAIELADQDATVFEAVGAAWSMPKEPESAAAERATAISQALVSASHVPFEVMRLAVEVLELATQAVEGNRTVASDAGVAAILAVAALDAAELNVEANLVLLDDPAFVTETRAETATLLASGHALAASVTAAARRVMGA